MHEPGRLPRRRRQRRGDRRARRAPRPPRRARAGSTPTTATPAVAEARRALDAGARGIKLHPRGEALHARPPGRRGPDRAGARARRCRCSSTPAAASPRWARTPSGSRERYPRASLILAHAAISDLALAVARAARRTRTSSSTPRGGTRPTSSRSSRSRRPARCCGRATRRTASRSSPRSRACAAPSRPA